MLLKAHECITEGNPGDVQALRQQLHDLRADAFSESKEEPPRGADDTEPAEAASASVRPPPKEELEAALAASTERMDLVKSLGADLLSQLEAVFSSQEDRGDLASAVMNVVERWRGQLPRSHEASVPSDMYMEHMGAACEDAVKAVDESDVNARRAFLAAYWERMSAASQATQVQAEREEEGLRARAAARRKRRAQQRAEAESPSKTSPSASRPRVSHANRHWPGNPRWPSQQKRRCRTSARPVKASPGPSSCRLKKRMKSRPVAWSDVWSHAPSRGRGLAPQQHLPKQVLCVEV